MPTKGDFIIDLLTSNKLSQSDRERILKLSALEYGKNHQELENVYSLIQNLENKTKSEYHSTKKENESLQALWKKHVEKNAKELNQLNEKVSKIARKIKNSESAEAESDLHEFWKKPNPKHVAEFMSLFNQREGLKYLTHDYDENSNFHIDKFLISGYIVFMGQTKKLNIPKSLWRIVKQFAFDSEQKAWTSISIDYKKPKILNIGWASSELRNWSKQNNLHPIRNEKYEEVINDFKRITRIKEPNLEKLVDATLSNALGQEIDDFTIEKSDLSKADFYTHVLYLKTALETIFKEIKEKSDSDSKKKITINFNRGIKDEFWIRQILITHHNSFPEKELQLILKEWKEKGSMGKVIDNLNGYCHWSVETSIENKPTRVNILGEENCPQFEFENVNTDGFTHVLTFYYK